MRIAQLLALVVVAVFCRNARASGAVDTAERPARASVAHQKNIRSACCALEGAVVCDHTGYGYSFERGTARPIAELSDLPKLTAAAEFPTVVFEVSGYAASDESEFPNRLAAERARRLRELLIGAGISVTRISMTDPIIRAPSPEGHDALAAV